MKVDPAVHIMEVGALLDDRHQNCEGVIYKHVILNVESVDGKSSNYYLELGLRTRQSEFKQVY